MLVASTGTHGTGYEILLAAHLVGVAAWLGGGIALVALSELAHLRDDHSSAELAELVRRFVFLPASIVVLGCGLGLLAAGGFDASSTWVVLALAGWAVSFALELPLALADPLRVLAAPEDHERGRRRHAHLALHLARLQAVVLVLVVVDMVLRPGA